MGKKNILTGSYKWAILMVIPAALFSCGRNQQEMPLEQVVSADFLTVKETTATIEKKYPGIIEGTVNVDIKPQVSGYLEAIYVKEGDYVKKGQTLFRIKGEVFKEQVNNSQATLNAALASQATAKIELEKIRPLVEGKVISEFQLETAQADYESATAQVAQAKAALGSSQINANFAVIKAPVSGYIGRIPNRIGNLVTPSDMVPLTTLSEIENVLVYFSMSEADFIEFIRDRKTDEGINTVETVMANGTLYEHKGRLEVASGNIDRSTGSIALKATFPNPDKILRSGGSARIILTKRLHGVITVPMVSVKDIQDKFFVFTLADSNKVAMKPIEIGGRAGIDYVLKTGLKSGEKIAINRIDMLTEGMPVVPSDVALDSLRK